MEDKKQDSSGTYPKMKPEDKQYKNQEEFIEPDFAGRNSEEGRDPDPKGQTNRTSANDLEDENERP
jgi:hypothetical protein